jgi:hypothetical protein
MTIPDCPRLETDPSPRRAIRASNLTAQVKESSSAGRGYSQTNGPRAATGLAVSHRSTRQMHYPAERLNLQFGRGHLSFL